MGLLLIELAYNGQARAYCRITFRLGESAVCSYTPGCGVACHRNKSCPTPAILSSSVGGALYEALKSNLNVDHIYPRSSEAAVDLIRRSVEHAKTLPDKVEFSA